MSATAYSSRSIPRSSPSGARHARQAGQWLNKYSRYTFTIEGHADERGTREYNIALGARGAERCANI